jgi:tRNA(adenine34) deaminase
MLAKTNGHDSDQAARDAAMMERCIALSQRAIDLGEYPFAAVICRGDEIVAETTNEVAMSQDVTRHAELNAVSAAQKKLARKDLSDCALYSNVEPCVMCSFPVRETRIKRVVFAISSPMMGGYSKWSVLRDGELSCAMPEAFGPVPEVIAGFMRSEAERVWWTWNPLIWAIIKHRGCFGSPHDVYEHLTDAPEGGGLMRRLLALHRHQHSA